MAVFQEGKVVAVGDVRDDLIRAEVAVEGGVVACAGFVSMLGPVDVGDTVVVNSTGIALGLGTGGTAFILWNLDGPGPPRGSGRGHIMKLRYTPWQTEVLAAEEPASPHHERLAGVAGIGGMPVVACGLHSQVAGVAAGIKAEAPGARVGYLMTDGGALPLQWSDLVAALRAARLIDVTCTAGHAFGGDLESVNVFSGLAALKWGGDVDVAIVAMGPGVVGTGSRLGFTGIEQGQVLDAAAALGGRGVAALRLAFGDPRDRHRGVSHHTLTALAVAARERCTVAVPKLPPARLDVVIGQLDGAGICARHELRFIDGRPGVDLLAESGIRPSSMGRTIDEVPELFLAASAAGALAATEVERAPTGA